MGCSGSSSSDSKFRNQEMMRRMKSMNELSEMRDNNRFNLSTFDYAFVMKNMNQVSDPYTIRDRLGKGGFASVKMAKFRGNEDNCFAMKSMKKEVDEMDMKPAIINELNILNSLDHPSIAKINESYEDETCIHAILEFSPGKSFAEMLIQNQGKMSINDTLKIFYQICKTASYLRKKEVIHRDFKPQNVMICKTDQYKYLDYEVQLIDFGFARFYKDSINDKQVLGSPHYIAPEVLDGHYGYESDVWSIGIMLYFTIAMEYPFEGDSDEELFQAIQEKELKFVPAEAWEKIPKDVKELIEKMLMKDPISRINIESIPIHSSFKNIHKFEENITLTDEEKKKLNRYYSCSPLQRKFIKFSIKYLTPTSKLEHCEKFLLLDKDNYGVLEFTTSDDYEDEEEGSEKEESSEEENSDEISDDYNPPDAPKTYQMTYSDYLGAVKDPDIVCGDKNIDLVFHTLNPSDMSDKILKKEMRKTLFIRNDEDPEAIREFENLDIKNSRGQLMFSKNWLRSYFANIKKRLTGKKK